MGLPEPFKVTESTLDQRIHFAAENRGERPDRNTTVEVIRVIAMVFVMFIHSPVVEDTISSPAVFFLKIFIAAGAVPCFFLLSGYLGARKISSKTISGREYLQGRARSLLIPFLFWNGVVLLLVFCAKGMGMDSMVRGNGSYFDVGPTIPSIISALLGLGRAPIVYQFWFLRDLIVVTVLGFVMCRRFPSVPLLPLLLFFIPVRLASSLGYYLLGYHLRFMLPLEKLPDVGASRWYCVGWLLIGIGVWAGRIAVPFPLLELGSAAFICMLAILARPSFMGNSLARLGPSVFFIYATHEPLQTILSRIWLLLRLPGYGSFAFFLLIPAIVFPFCALWDMLLRRLVPKQLAFITGGR